ncbi:Amidohydro_3 domain-containing protein [Frankia sp. Hr75.2]|nr:Amidohydro_3 domain-containing protein [Frankia sp. Hr75.2]
MRSKETAPRSWTSPASYWRPASSTRTRTTTRRSSGTASSPRPPGTASRRSSTATAGSASPRCARTSAARWAPPWRMSRACPAKCPTPGSSGRSRRSPSKSPPSTGGASGSTSARSSPTPRCGCSCWVREKGALGLTEAVWRLTGQPAEVFGLTDRGLIRPRYAADLVAFAPAPSATTIPSGSGTSPPAATG